MLPSYYRFKARNDGGVSSTVTVKFQPYKVLAGVTTYETEATPINAASVAGGASNTSAAIDNTTAKDHGGFATFTVNPGTTPSGNQQWFLFLEKSNDNSTFGSQEEQFVGVLLLTASGAASASYEVRL